MILCITGRQENREIPPLKGAQGDVCVASWTALLVSDTPRRLPRFLGGTLERVA
jgi:hypothetical protein